MTLSSSPIAARTPAWRPSPRRPRCWAPLSPCEVGALGVLSSLGGVRWWNLRAPPMASAGEQALHPSYCTGRGEPSRRPQPRPPGPPRDMGPGWAPAPACHTTPGCFRWAPALRLAGGWGRHEVAPGPARYALAAVPRPVVSGPRHLGTGERKRYPPAPRPGVKGSRGTFGLAPEATVPGTPEVRVHGRPPGPAMLRCAASASARREPDDPPAPASAHTKASFSCRGMVT